MSTSLLYHSFGIHEYDYVRTRYEGGQTIFSVKPKQHKLRCPDCQSREITPKGQRVRRLRMEPVGKRPTFLEVLIQRVVCTACGIIKQVKLPFADERRSYTRRFERFTLELLQVMSISDVAAHLGVGWDTVKDIHKRHLNKRYGKPKLGHLRCLAVDEVYVGKKHFLTVVMDLESGAVMFVGEGRDGACLEPFWKRLKRSGACIEAVAMDMGPAFISAVQKHQPQASIVFDHFHVIKLFNEKLAQLRRTEQKKAEDKDKMVLKGTRWLLLKKPRNLDDGKDEKERLHEALQVNKALATAYYMKEDLGRFWRQRDKESAAFLLDDWVKRARISGIGVLERFADTLSRHRNGILAYYDFNRISTGPLEGMNNKIGLMQRRAYGYADMEYFKLRIMALHEAVPVLVG